jgi:hypothetical protein
MIQVDVRDKRTTNDYGIWEVELRMMTEFFGDHSLAGMVVLYPHRRLSKQPTGGSQGLICVPNSTIRPSNRALLLSTQDLAAKTVSTGFAMPEMSKDSRC